MVACNVVIVAGLAENDAFCTPLALLFAGNNASDAPDVPLFSGENVPSSVEAPYFFAENAGRTPFVAFSARKTRRRTTDLRRTR